MLVADRKALVGAALTALLEREGDLAVVAQVPNLENIPAAAAREHPNVVLLGLDPVDTGDLASLGSLRGRLNGSHVLALAAYDGPGYASMARALGARGVVSKGSPTATLLEAVREVGHGREYWQEAPGGSDAGPLRERFDRLTPRQRELFRHVVGGHTNRDIAARLGIAVKTVEAHRAGMMRALDVPDVPALTRLAVRLGIAPV